MFPGKDGSSYILLRRFCHCGTSMPHWSFKVNSGTKSHDTLAVSLYLSLLSSQVFFFGLPSVLMASISPEVLYHSIPQAPILSGAIDLDNDEPAGIIPDAYVTRIRWIHFLLGEGDFFSLVQANMLVNL